MPMGTQDFGGCDECQRSMKLKSDSVCNGGVEELSTLDVINSGDFLFYDEVCLHQYENTFHRNVEGQAIKVGICAMAKKVNSKPMKEILRRLSRFEHLQIEVLDEETIVQKAVTDWPVVDAFIAFFSTGFPLEKAIEYKNLYHPYVVNDLEAQYTLKDRREVYKILVREGIEHPRYAVMNREEEEKGTFEENEDAIEVNGMSFQRPFVEKPVNAEDHNINIYFPVSAGGGCQRLFRKVRHWSPVSKTIIGSRSSVYSQVSQVRKTGSYIYEVFMPTDGTDVKVYTVGPDYAHAEARKSPALDGKVERDKDGKEVRYPVILSAAEKMIARKVCLAFKQNVCGFDLLRTGGKSYVCDVNGFSFVKNSTKYYDDCANVLGTMIVRALAPQLHIQNVALVLGAAPEDIPVVPTTSGSMMELRCVIAVIRHGDRTPKQKMKMEVKNKKFFELFEKYGGYKKGHLKLKKPKQLQEVLDIARDLLCENPGDNNPEVQEKKAKLRQLKLVLEMYEFSGINRKIQLKYQPFGRPPHSSDGLYPSISKGYEFPKEPSLVLILKWGGELTPAGRYQAEDLGKAFRTLYPGGQGEFETPGLGFLRLHSTFRHDLKIYASDEGRVQMTAAAFTKGLLALEGELTPILVSMVKSANTNGLLDKEGETSKYQHIVKETLMEMLNRDMEFTEEDVQVLAPTRSLSLLKAIEFIKNPKRMNDRVYEMVQEITAKIKTLKMELKSRELKLYHGESWELLIRRWSKLEKDYKLKNGQYDISKIPDIYDCIKYDLQHNQKTLQYERSEELFLVSKALADIVIPQEYGISVEEKLHISQSICTPLMRKIHCDLHQGCVTSDEESTRLNSRYSKGVSSPERFVRTRLYFTSESHIHSLLNMLRYGGLCDEVKDEQWKKAMDFLSTTPELNYMTQINIMMFEDPSKKETSPEKYHVELHFSPGAYTSSDKSVVNPGSSGYRTSFLVRQKLEAGKKLLEKGTDEICKEVIREESVTDESVTLESPESSKGLEDSNVTQVEEKSSASIMTSSSVPNNQNSLDYIYQNSFDPNNQVCVQDGEGEPSQIRDGDVVQMPIMEGASVGTNAVEPQNVSVCKTERQSKMETIQNESHDGTAVETEKALVDGVNSEIKAADCETLKNSLTENVESKGIISALFNKVVHTVIGDVSLGSRGTTSRQSGANASKDLEESSHDEVIFDDIYDHEKLSDEETITITSNNELTVKEKHCIGPKSPDPDIPEWDWDDGLAKPHVAGDRDQIEFPGASKRTSDPDVDSDNSVSQPIQIQKTATKKPTRTDSSTSYEEKRSKSLEEHEKKETSMGKTKTRLGHFPFHSSLSDVFMWGEEGEQITILEKHYCTIHLPIKTDSHHSFSSLLYLNPEAFKDSSHTMRQGQVFRMASYSSPSLSELAFDGFNMVPSLKPLETLHNNLTMKDMDIFLRRATCNKFFTPVNSPMYGPTAITSSKWPEYPKPRSTSGISLPSSCSSSAGPSSPITSSTPVDFFNKVKLYIMDNTKNDPMDNYLPEQDPSQSSSNQKPEFSHQTAAQPVKTCAQNSSIPLAEQTSQVTQSQPIKILNQNSLLQQSEMQTGSPGNAAIGSSSGAAPGPQSAFKVVSRANSQKSSMFYVSQVSEDSLKVKKNPESNVLEDKNNT
ncbi:inositol hexakisphosphate and diphosphoinositol-pentakisphosphate kinase 2-like isoform X4 [Dreissena polymorpha]|uniref:inositol hexakisphosphate and diphosphoinositol-pentakisphosphate kinase 2-like isoform X4 n=1 Tax=Dreissena polymorpha TaxID=45954 RepID=UPI002263C1F1|nr:inositol hexakisphosphate and diphosphoinositol-pentakisphosphate kinase 2-like isoform X4 [Dreissena polymorpha]